MYTAPNASPAVSAKEGLMAWVRGAEQWLDNRGRKAWIFAMILGFIFAWPIGLGLLGYMIWSKRMFGSSCAHKYDRKFERGTPWGRHGNPAFTAFRPTGNAAFDAYKADTIRRLQEEQDAFEAFLQRLRDAKDKSEFDAFMADRATKAAAPTVTPAADDVAKPGEY
jgi:hypothetical protein